MELALSKRAGLITYTETTAKGRCELPGCEYETFEMAETVKQPVHKVRGKLQHHMGVAHRLKVDQYYFALVKEIVLNVPAKTRAGA